MEILISIVVIAIGLLGLAGLQTKMVGVELEAYQRSHALILLDDIMNRIRADEASARAGAYDALPGDCTTPGTTAAANMCAWLNAIQGVSGGEEVGSLIGGQGCVESIGIAPKTLRVTVAWQGLTPTAAPEAGITCGADDYGDEAMRRVVSGVVVILPEEEE
ncbi:pilus assembly protein [Azoarcus sp. DD4]|uniref:type IV pilus modification PilV family protein n=1 Tax=Azoarcus sp. DD4 TaxID=2027405 RepID=UPI00143D3359|nr:pilus assembly protein [Azoarcus sp. DD4]